MIIYGINPAVEALRNTPGQVSRLHLKAGKPTGRLREVVGLARAAGVPIRFEEPALLDRKAGTGKHQGVVAELVPVAYQSLDSVLSHNPSLLLALDGVEDPHNLGAVLRTAEATGVDGVLLPQRRTCGITPAVVKASAGAALAVPVVRVGNLVQAFKTLKQKGFWVAGLDIGAATRPWEMDADLPLVLVAGSEGSGLRPLVGKHCDFRLGLPMKGKVGSLNLSVAVGMVLYEVISQRARDQHGPGQ